MDMLDSLIFNMPVKPSLKLMTPIRSDHANAERKLFDESARNYWEIGEDFPALKSYYMTALCYRALGDRNKSKGILENVLNKTRPDDPWRANPLQVMAWLIQDEGKLADSEKLLRQTLNLV